MGGTIAPVHLFLVMYRLRSHHGRRRGRRRNLARQQRILTILMISIPTEFSAQLYSMIPGRYQLGNVRETYISCRKGKST